MNRLTYAAARKAVSVAIDVALKKVEKDREKARNTSIYDI